MSYVKSNLMSDERILFSTKKHLIIFLFPVVLTVFSFYATSYMGSNPILSKLAWLPWLLTGAFWLYVWLEYQFSEFAVTNKRIMMREGVLFRHSNELRLETISRINVDQSLLGQWLGYGMVSINAFGAFDSFTTIAKPGVFQRHINERVDQLH